MPYVITQNCCKDASCVTVCPVNCIHPSPPEDGFDAEPMLFVDPRVCIDCGACADACPVDAIVPADTLAGPERAYVAANADYFADSPVPPASGPLFRTWHAPSFDWSLPSDFAGLDVAVVGTGPAGLYAAELLLLHTRSTVTLIDRLPVAGGLINFGVAPDHPGTKRIGHTFARLYTHPRVRMQLGVDVGGGRTTVEALRSRFDAVIFAVGASEGRRLGVVGEDLTGVVTGPDFVGWYNGHPDIAPGAVSLDTQRAVVVGTGNVALDVVRILTSNPDALESTTIARHALSAIRDGDVGEVVLLGRRGPVDAAYSMPELLALRELPDVELVIDDHDPAIGAAIDDAAARSHASILQGLRRLRPDYTKAPEAGTKRIVLRFVSEIAQIEGDGRVEDVVFADGTRLSAGLVVTSIGYRGRPLPGLPFDADTGTIPNDHGRVRGVDGAYTVGWIKRGSSGGIGDNRVDAADTVHTLLDDAVAGKILRRGVDKPGRLSRLRRSLG